MEKPELVELVKKLQHRKKYGLVWEEKLEDVVEQCKRELPVLEEVVERAIEKDKDGSTNLLIEGDNYHALSVLNYTHANKVDVIYIDPPYNTGQQDFKYNDRWIDKDDEYRHSKWLSFMSKRLTLARDLLNDGGLIFISIDDNESAQLKLLCNDIFKEENLLDVFYIQVRYASKSLNEKDDFQKLIEQVLIYTKNKTKFKPNKPSDEYDLNKFRFKVTEKAKGKTLELGRKKVEIFLPGEYEITEEENGSMEFLKATWASGSVLKGNTSGKFFHNYLETRKDVDGLGVLYKVHGIGEDGIGYRYFTGPKKETATKGQFYSGVPLSRRKDIDENGSSRKERPVINFYDYSGDFGNIRHEGLVDFRSGKKPTKMLKNLINLHRNKDVLVLDFFAGSGSTAEAVLMLNEDDGGNRRFILCTNNENNIAEDITHSRIKNVTEGYNSTGAIPTNLRYFRTAFVSKSKVSDDTRRELVKRSTEMICVRENAFEKVADNKNFKIYRDKNHVAGILFDLDSISEFKEKIKKQALPAHIYVFSLTNDTFDEDFDDLELKHELCPIPESILEVYRKLFKE